MYGTSSRRTQVQVLSVNVLTVLEIRKQVKKKSPALRTGQSGVKHDPYLS
jgi:hypothetical protein